MCYEENKSLFSDVWKMAKFFAQMFVFFNMMTDSFLVEKRGTLERAWRYVCKNPLNLDCQHSITFAIFQVVYKWIIIWKEFLLPTFWSLFSLFFWRSYWGALNYMTNITLKQFTKWRCALWFYNFIETSKRKKEDDTILSNKTGGRMWRWKRDCSSSKVKITRNLLNKDIKNENF